MAGDPMTTPRVCPTCGSGSTPEPVRVGKTSKWKLCDDHWHATVSQSGGEPRQCKDYAGAPSCCASCHEDAELFFPAYPLCQIMNGNEIVAEVCCAVAHWIRGERPAEKE